MNQKAILIVALRVTALILLAGSIDDIGKIIIRDVPLLEFGETSTNMQERLIIDYSVLLPFIAKVILITILWFFPTLLLNKISDLPKDDVYPTAENFMMPLVALMGLYLVIMSVMGILDVIFLPFLAQGSFFLIPIVIRLVIGLWLLLGNRGVTNLIYKLRSTKVR